MVVYLRTGPDQYQAYALKAARDPWADQPVDQAAVPALPVVRG
jgi:hypothetical protein